MKFFLTLFTLLISTAALSASSSTLLLQAQVPRRISVQVTPAAVATALDLTTTQNNLFIGIVNERSNSKTGYKGSIKSANLGKLKRAGGPEVFAYSLKISGVPIDISSAAGTSYSFNNTQLVDTNRDIRISYTGIPSEQMVEGSYNDTITFTISAI